jgi:rare lipoprotein A
MDRPMIRPRLLALAALSLVVTGCATGRRTAPAPPPSSHAVTGQASWYGEAHHGKKTASGEVYDRTQRTAAHRTLPMGTHVRVTNVENGRSVVVRINDRGPFRPGRIIDLSQAAAREIGTLDDGLFPVRLEVLEDAGAARNRATIPSDETGSRDGGAGGEDPRRGRP